jgi:hypothetical protein
MAISVPHLLHTRMSYSTEGGGGERNKKQNMPRLYGR